MVKRRYYLQHCHRAVRLYWRSRGSIGTSWLLLTVTRERTWDHYAFKYSTFALATRNASFTVVRPSRMFSLKARRKEKWLFTVASAPADNDNNERRKSQTYCDEIVLFIDQGSVRRATETAMEPVAGVAHSSLPRVRIQTSYTEI